MAPHPEHTVGPDAAQLREHQAYLHWERARWDGWPSHCPHCGHAGRCRYLRPADGTARATRTGVPSARRLWRCGACRRQFSVLTGTVFAGTRVPLSVLTAVLEARRLGRVRTAAQVAGATGLTPASARRLLARVAAAERFGARDLHEVLQLPPPARDAVMAAAPGRRRPRPQHGASAEYR